MILFIFIWEMHASVLKCTYSSYTAGKAKLFTERKGFYNLNGKGYVE